MAGTVSMSGLTSDTNWTSLITDIINAQKSATVTPLENSKSKQQAALTAWQTFNTKISTLTAYLDVNNLDEDKGYALYTSSLSSADSSITAADILSVSLGSATGPGNYTVEVSALAKAEKISSDAFTSNNTALGFVGDIVVNGKAVTFTADDTLLTVAGKINDVAAGVTASVLKVSDTEYRLMLESQSTGAEGITLRNGGSSSILESLNLVQATAQLAHPSGADALGDTFSGKTSTISSLLDLTTPQSGTIRIRGTDDAWVDVAVDLETDSLETIAANITAAAPTGVTASVETDEDGDFQLKLTNVIIDDLQDSNNILETIGVIKSSAKNTLRSGQDASFEIDGYSMTSASNTIADAVEGVTFTLTGTNAGKPVDVAISQDNAQVSSKITTVVANINAVLSYIKEQNTYSSSTADSETTSNPLMGQAGLVLVKSNITSALFTEVEGNTTYRTASDIGIRFQQDGTISVTSSALSNALSSNRQETLSVLKSFNDSLYENLKLYVDPSTGTITSMATSIQDTIARIDTRISDLNARYERQREVLEKRFNALEVLISTSNATKSWLTQQTNAMTKSS